MKGLLDRLCEGKEWKLNASYIEGVRKWFDAWLGRSKDITAGKDAIDHYGDIFQYLRVFHGDLLTSKGLWPEQIYGDREKDLAGDVPEYFVPELESLTKKLIYAFDEINSDIGDLIADADRFGPGKIASLDIIGVFNKRSVLESKKLYDKSILILDMLSVFLSRWDKYIKARNVDLNTEKENEFSIGKAKVIVRRTELGTTPYAFSRPTINDRELRRYIMSIDSAKSLLEKAGFGKAWYGVIVLYPEGLAKRFSDNQTRGATYTAKDDHIVIYTLWGNGDTATRNLVHEVGHRWYYKFMNQGERARFDSYWGEVASTTQYGSTKASEDFSEVFASYVMGEKLSRDQRERFKEFATKRLGINRHESKDGIMKTLLERIELMEASSVSEKWIAGIRKWWKKWVSDANGVSKLRGEKAYNIAISFLKDGIQNIERFKKDLLYKKGYWVYGMDPNPKNDSGINPMESSMRDMDEIVSIQNDIIDRLRFSHSAVYDDKSFEYANRPDLRSKEWGPNKDLDAFNAEISILPHSIKDIDSIFSGKILRRFSAHINKWSGLGMDLVDDADVDLEFSIGNLKVVVNPSVDNLMSTKDVTGSSDDVNSPSKIKLYQDAISKAKALISKSGFGSLWYGLLTIDPSVKGMGFVLSTGQQSKAHGLYVIRNDSIVMTVPEDGYSITGFSGWASTVLIHELGHRWYYKFMNQGERARFDSYFGSVAPVRSYGSENPAEDFATVFEYYVTGEKLNRDQRERFKEFATKRLGVKRNESKGTMWSLLQRLEEASYSNDLEYRKRAVSFIEGFKDFVSKHQDMLIPMKGGFYVLADKFWNDPVAQNLYVFLYEKGARGSNVKAAVGKFRGNNAIVLPMLSSPSDLSHIEDRIGFNSALILHELVHLMDKGYEKGRNPDISNMKSYYNHASEWNAFWQEGAFTIENLVANPILHTKERWAKTIGLTFDEFKKKSTYAWDKGFVSNMDDATSKRFDKRLYQLWLEISKKIPEK